VLLYSLLFVIVTEVIIQIYGSGVARGPRGPRPQSPEEKILVTAICLTHCPAKAFHNFQICYDIFNCVKDFIVLLLHPSYIEWYWRLSLVDCFCMCSLSIRFNVHFPGEPGLASVY